MMEQSELESMVLELKDKLDNILNTVAESEKKYQHDVGVKGFTERNGEALGKYVEKLKKLNGEDLTFLKVHLMNITTLSLTLKNLLMLRN